MVIAPPARGPGGRQRRATTGTWSASGSASKNSRRMKPSGPAIRTDGIVWIVVLYSLTVAL